MASNDKQAVQQKTRRPDKPKQTAVPEGTRLGPDMLLSALPQPAALDGLPNHSTTRSVRQAQVLQSQRQHGNAHVQRMLARQARTLNGNDHGLKPAASARKDTRPPGVQAKLTVNEPGERLEQEADQVSLTAAEANSALPQSVEGGIASRVGKYAPTTCLKQHLLARERSYILQKSKDHVAVQRQVAEGSERSRGSRADLGRRVSVLEKRQEAAELDLRWRAQFGSRLATYRQAVYALTQGFGTAITEYGNAHGDQAQADAVKYQALTAILNLGVTALVEPFLQQSLGHLGEKLDAVVEYIENPMVTATTGAVGVAAVALGRRQPAYRDPVILLSRNMQSLERHNQLFEDAFLARSDRTSRFTDEQWLAWDRVQQNDEYTRILHDMDEAALPDITRLRTGVHLADTIERYFWAAWIRRWYNPGVSGLMVGPHLAMGMIRAGVALQAGVRLDTISFPLGIFMNHQPEDWDSRLAGWARSYNERLTWL